LKEKKIQVEEVLKKIYLIKNHILDISNILSQQEIEDEQNQNLTNIASKRSFEMESNFTNKFNPPDRNFSNRSDFKSNRLNQECNINILYFLKNKSSLN
jgi:spore cortex formation protein SpoVR/YcgB (stage V sporulation)